MSGDCLAKFDPDSSSWRTCQVSLVEDLNTFSGPWPRSGILLHGICSALPIAAHRKKGKGGSSWQTPGVDSFRSRGGDRKEEMGLDQQARNWPTPTVGDSFGAGSRNLEGSKAHAGVSLTDMVLFGNSTTPRRPPPEEKENSRNWPTPTASTGGAENLSPGGRSPKLVSVASVSPPIPQDQALGRKAIRPVLNPQFVEHLMGFPIGFSACEPLAMESYQAWRLLHSAPYSQDYMED